MAADLHALVQEWRQRAPLLIYQQDAIYRICADELERALSESPSQQADADDARRFRDLCELVQWGEWGCCDIEITDSYGNSKQNWFDGVEDMPALCDKWANAATICRNVRTKPKDNPPQEASE